MTWSLIVPVKRLPLAKSRLDPAQTGISGHDVALAFALDTVSAVLATEAVTRLIVVCSDPEVIEALSGAAGHGVELVAEPAGGGLNRALRHAADRLRSAAPDRALACLPADLPALRAAELQAALAAAAAYPRAVVADAEEIGTTLLTAAAGTVLDPQYGPGSLLAHIRSGAVALRGAWPGLRRDVDTADDLRQALELGVGAASTAAFGCGSGRLP